MNFVDHLKKLDWVLIGATLVVVAFGLAGIWSSGLAKGDFGNFEKQLVFLAVGLALMFAISFFDYRMLRDNSYLILLLYALCLALLAGLHFFAPAIRGTRGWGRAGFFTLCSIRQIHLN